MTKLALSFVATVMVASPAGAIPISVDAGGDPFEVFHFRDVRGPNSVGLTEGDRLTFGAVNVVPNGKDGTTGVARQSGVEVPLFFVPTDVTPNQFGNSVAYNPALSGPWEFTFQNGADERVVNTPSPGSIGGVKLATDLSLSNPGLTPTFSWTNPVTPDTVVVSIYDLLDRNEIGTANRFFVSNLGSAATDYTVPDGLLEDGGLYAFRVDARNLYDSGTNPSGSSQAGASKSISRAFFEFAAGDLPGDPEEFFLPSVDVSGDVPVFNFDNEVLAGRVEYYDPFVAIGYDYAIGEGDPLFASVILPDIGDGIFELFVEDGSGFAFVGEMMAGEEYEFATGVSAFRILGIETDAGLDPADGTAFVTGLSFVGDGRFTGTMTPIVEEVNVPAPPAALLVATGLIGFGALRRSRRTAK